MTDFLLKHSQELSEKYPGKHIAVAEDNVVAVDSYAVNAYKKAKKKFTCKEISMFYMPTDEETITLILT